MCTYHFPTYHRLRLRPRQMEGREVKRRTKGKKVYPQQPQVSQPAPHTSLCYSDSTTKCIRKLTQQNRNRTYTICIHNTSISFWPYASTHGRNNIITTYIPLYNQLLTHVKQLLLPLVCDQFCTTMARVTHIQTPCIYMTINPLLIS